MTDWEIVWEIFFSGIIGVFIVMLLLQFSTQATSAVVGYLEKRGNKDQPDTQKS